MTATTSGGGAVTGIDSSAPAAAGPVPGGWVTLDSSADGGPTLTGRPGNTTGDEHEV